MIQFSELKMISSNSDHPIRASNATTAKREVEQQLTKAKRTKQNMSTLVGNEQHGRCYNRSKNRMAKIELRRPFTIAQLFVAFAVATLVFSSTTVSSKTPTLLPQNNQHRRRAGTGRDKTNSNLNAILPASSSTNKPEEAAWVSGFKNSLASGLAAGCSKLLLAPFDTIKTMQQAALVSGNTPLSLSTAAQEILKRPKGFLEFYVSTNFFGTYDNVECVTVSCIRRRGQNIMFSP